MCIEHNASTHYTHHKQNVYCYVLHSGLAKLRRKKCNLGEIVCLNQWFFVCLVLSNEENFKKNYLYVICTTIFRILEHFVYVLLSQDQKNQNFLFEISWKYSWKRQDQRWILFIFCLWHASLWKRYHQIWQKMKKTFIQLPQPRWQG